MTSDAGAGIRILGSVRSADGKGIVRMEDRYNTDIVDLWSALTDPGRLARWIAEVEGDLRLGGEFHARFTSGWEGTGAYPWTSSPPTERDGRSMPRISLLTSPGANAATSRLGGASSFLPIESWQSTPANPGRS